MSILLFLLSAVPDTLHLDFKQTLNRAYQEAPAIKLARIAIEQRGLDKNAVLSTFYPQVNAQGSISRLQEPLSATLELLPGAKFDITLSDEKMEVFQTSIQLPLWTFGRRLEGYALAEEAIEAARLDSIKALRKLHMQVVELYQNIIALSEMEALMKRALDNATKHRLSIEKKYNDGLVSSYNLLKAKTKEKELQPDLIEVQQQKQTLSSRLGILLNIGPDTVLALKAEWNTPDSLPSATEDEVLFSQPDWNQLQLGKRMLGRQIKIKQREALPVIAAGADYTVQRSPLTNGVWDDGWRYSISAKMPLTTGFKKYNEVKKLEKELEKLGIQEDALRTQLRFELKESIGKFETAKAKLEATKAKETEAEELFRIASQRYREGLLADIDLMDAELGLAKARAERVMAECKVIIAYEHWLNLIGGKQ